mgnify:CR=1 FL=1
MDPWALVDQELCEWKAKLVAEDWDRIQVVISGARTPRKANLATQYFSRLLGEPGEGIPITYVPFRNGQILSIAAAWAEALGAPEVYLGAVEEDSTGYPDCREETMTALQQALRLGMESNVQIHAPLMHLSKKQTVELARDLGGLDGGQAAFGQGSPPGA